MRKVMLLAPAVVLIAGSAAAQTVAGSSAASTVVGQTAAAGTGGSGGSSTGSRSAESQATAGRSKEARRMGGVSADARTTDGGPGDGGPATFRAVASATAAGYSSEAPAAEFWREIGDSTLTRLVAQALEGAPSVQEAVMISRIQRTWRASSLA